MGPEHGGLITNLYQFTDVMGKTSFVSKETVVLLQLGGEIRTFQINFGFWETAQPTPTLAQQ